ncbi:MAG: NADH-quinone oxidoreductase subunit L [Vampirovibrionales bacterium]|nr:NADH-quinone oxidoreductase subunit L [Vampirovibrionales bacterium]
MHLWFMDINTVWMVPLYPLLAFLAIVILRGFTDVRARVRLGHPPTEPVGNKMFFMALTVGATFLGLLHAVGTVSWLLGQEAGHVQAIERNWTWLQAGDFKFSLGYLVDAMSVMMLFVVTFISLLIQIYTHGYMEKDAGYAKFYSYLALFNFSMLGLVLSTNLFQTYIFWELVGVSSYLLIGFWFHKPSAAAACIKAFLMNRVGDFGFLIGILGFLYFSWGSWQNYLSVHPEQAVLSFQALGVLAPQVLGAAGAGLFSWICVLLFMGPMAKSAQVPLHTWLPDAMEGPTPISALIHAATMVAAGVYLVGRLYPVFTPSEAALPVVAIIGCMTALIGATIALTQTDIKKALAYSTMSQLGYMMAAMGVGAFAAALFHLFTHAFFKAMLFLCSGSVIHACEDEQDMRRMGGLRAKLPLTAYTYLAGTLAIAGFPLTSGFFSKDMILDGAFHYGAPVIYWVLTATAALTAFYMMRTYLLTFEGKYRGEAHVHHEHPWMVLPLVILAVPSLGVGYLLSGFFSEKLAFAHYIHFDFVPPGATAVHHPESLMALLTSPTTLISTAMVFAGLLLSWFFYGTEAGRQVPEKIRTAPVLSSFNSLFAHKWYFDEIYTFFVDKIYLVFAKGSAGFDRQAIDGLVNFSGQSVMGSGQALKQLQSGRVQTYIAVMFFGAVVLALFMIYCLY